MTKETLWLNSESTTSKESKQLGRIFISAGGGLAAVFCLSSIRSVRVVFRILLNTINMFPVDLWSLQSHISS